MKRIDTRNNNSCHQEALENTMIADVSKMNDLHDESEAEGVDGGGTSFANTPSKVEEVTLPAQSNPVNIEPDPDLEKEPVSENDSTIKGNFKEMNSFIYSQANNSNNTSCNIEDKSSDNSNYNSSVKENSQYVKENEECVKDSDSYVQEPSEIREKKVENTCKEDFTDLEILEQYMKIVKVEANEVTTGINESNSHHFCFIEGIPNDEQSANEIEELEKMFSRVNQNTWAYRHKHHIFIFIVSSTEATQQRINCFLRKFRTIHLITKHDISLLIKGISRMAPLKPLPLKFLIEYKTVKERTLCTNLHRMLWDDDLSKCISKVIRYYSTEKKRSLGFLEAENILNKLGFTGLFRDRRWRLKLERMVKKYEHSFDKSKLQINPVSLDAFSYILQSEVDPTDLIGKNQSVTLDEVQFLLFRITKKVYTEGKPCVLSRSYFKKFEKEFEAKTGRKLNNHKLAQITGLLVEYGYISKTKGHNTPSIYDMGKNNPYYDM